MPRNPDSGSHRKATIGSSRVAVVPPLNDQASRPPRSGNAGGRKRSRPGPSKIALTPVPVSEIISDQIEPRSRFMGMRDFPQSVRTSVTVNPEAFVEAPKRNKAEQVKVRMLVSPEIAAKWIESSGPQRALTESTALSYARDLEMGNWNDTGEPFRFDQAGKFRDGMHRAWAILLSGVSMVADVIYNMSEEALRNVDKGKPRSWRDELRMRGEPGHANDIAAITKLVWRATQFGIGHGLVGKATTSELDSTLYAHPIIQDGARVANRRALKTLAPRSSVGFAYVILSEQNQEKADEFFSLLEKGAQLEKTSPIWVLWDRLIKIRMSRSVRRPNNVEYSALIVKAWNAWREGRNMQVLAWRAEEPFPIPVA